MKKYFDTIVNTQGGGPVVGATITVTKTSGGGAATLYSDNGITQLSGNTVTTDTNGYFEFYLSNGRYTIQISKTGMTTRSITDVLIFDQATSYCSVKDPSFGAVGDGTTNDTTAIQNALNSGVKIVYLPAGTYKITSTITVPKNVSLIGEGSGAVTLDGSSASYGSLTNGYHLTTADATLTALPALSVNVAKRARTLTFASAPSVSVNDVLIIYNPTDGSWHADRTYYRAGEMVRVAAVSGSTVTLQGTTEAAYTTSAVTVYKLTNASTCVIQGFSLKGLSSTTNQTYGVNLTHCVDSTVRDVRVTNCSYMGIAAWTCFNTAIENCFTTEDFSANFGGDYGLALINCHIARVFGGYFAASRHALTLTSNGQTGDVPCRHVHISKAYVTTTHQGSIQALDFHGSAEHCTVEDCTIDGGVIVAGDNGRVINNTIKCGGMVGVFFTELVGANFEIANNTIINDGTSDSSYGLFADMGGDGSTGLTANTTRGGTIVVKNNKMVFAGSASDDTLLPIQFNNMGYTGSEELNLVVANNTVSAPTTSIRIGRGKVRNQGGTSSSRPWDSVDITGNTFDCCSGIYADATTATYSILNLNVLGNRFENGGGSQCFAIFNVRDNITVKGNTFKRQKGMAGWFEGGTNKVNTIHVQGNTCWNNNTSKVGDTAKDASFRLAKATNVVIKDNFSDSRNEYIAVASNTSLVIGETITGATSGATAIVKAKVGSTWVMIETSRSGSYTGTENLNGSSSGAAITTYGGTTAYTEDSFFAFDTVTNLWQDQNLHLRALPNDTSAGSVTTPSSVLATISADKGNASSTFTPGDAATTIYYNTAITANRTVTLTTTNAWNGLKVRVVRTANCTGAFNINVGTGPLKALAAASTWCDVMYNGSAWVLVGYGTL